MQKNQTMTEPVKRAVQERRIQLEGAVYDEIVATIEQAESRKQLTMRVKLDLESSMKNIVSRARELGALDQVLAEQGLAYQGPTE